MASVSQKAASPLFSDNFCTIPAESDGQKEAQPSSYFSMVDVDESPHGSMDPTLKTSHACGRKQTSRCFFASNCEHAKIHVLNRAGPSLQVRTRVDVKHVSVNSYVTLNSICNTASLRGVSLLHLMMAQRARNSSGHNK